MATRAGWYPDTTASGQERYWDGERWTDARRPIAHQGGGGLLGSLSGRLAIAIGALLLIAAAAATFVPASVGEESCGTWFNAKWTEEKGDELAEEFEGYADQFETLNEPEEAAKARGGAINAATIYPRCSNRLDERLGATVVLVVLALLLPGAVLFVGGARRRQTARI